VARIVVSKEEVEEYVDREADVHDAVDEEEAINIGRQERYLRCSMKRVFR
jgi:hypothetical protein